MFAPNDLGYWTVTVEQAMLTDKGDVMRDRKTQPEARYQKARYREHSLHLRR